MIEELDIGKDEPSASDGPVIQIARQRGSNWFLCYVLLVLCLHSYMYMEVAYVSG